MKMKAKAILNVAVGGRHRAGQKRLAESLDVIGDSSARLFHTQWPLLPHIEVPYGFKIDAFDFLPQSLDIGPALWCDASVWAEQPLDPVWAWIDKHGVLLLGDGWTVGQWTSDDALALYGIDRDEAMTMQLCYACVVGIDLGGPRGRDFLDRWRTLRDAGAFKGPWQNANREASFDPRCLGHRHDQSAASFIAHEMGIRMAPMAEFLSLDAEGGNPVFRAQGL